ncbi:MAG: STAS domain-containing protein [Candidatus Muiribacteriaceae bacterium]
MIISKELIDDVVVVKIDGEVEKEDELEIRTFFDELLTEPATAKIVIDASAIQYMGSSTLGIFSKIYQEAGKNGGRVIFASLSNFVKKIFKITTFDKYLDVKYSVKDAVDELRNP